MEKELLIKALRYCADENNICTEIENCGYFGKEYFCQDALLHDAADALEADEKRIAELERILKAVQENSGINFRLWQEAEAQLPKRGEWIMDGKYNRHCSRCNEDVVWSFNYCPNCGARMRTVTDCHTLEEGERC